MQQSLSMSVANLSIYNNRTVEMCGHARGLRGWTDARAGTSNPAAERRDGLTACIVNNRKASNSLCTLVDRVKKSFQMTPETVEGTSRTCRIYEDRHCQAATSRPSDHLLLRRPDDSQTSNAGDAVGAAAFWQLADRRCCRRTVSDRRGR